MEKIVEQKEVREITNRYHEFYCDKCGKFISQTFEYDDGYYAKPETYDIQVLTDKGKETKRYKYKTCLCKECNEKFAEEVKKRLLNYGFKID